MRENTIKELENSIMHKKFPNDIRIFLPTQKNFIYANNGRANISMSIYGIMSNLKAERGSILDALVKFEFVVFEMVRFSVVGFEPTKTILEVVKSLSPKQRVNVLTKTRILKKSLGNKLIKIIDLRNQIAHKFSVSEAIWNNLPLFEKHNFQDFQKEIQEVWDEVIIDYNKMISRSNIKSIIQRIDNYDSKSKKI